MIIYCILVHTNPAQLLRLIERLRLDGGTKFYVHVDLNTDIEQFISLRFNNDVCFISNRFKCSWGHFNIVKATIALMREVVKFNYVGRVILLSGQCYPLRKPNEISDFYNLNKAYSFIELGTPDWEDLYRRLSIFRIDLTTDKRNYIFCEKLNKSTIKHYLKGRINTTDLIKLLKGRRWPEFLKFAGGSQWWSLEINLINEILDFIKRYESELFDYFKYSHCADEYFFHSILNTILLSSKDIMVKTTNTYSNWVRPNSILPVLFNFSDIIELDCAKDSYLFARKFDSNFDSKILDFIDSNFLK